MSERQESRTTLIVGVVFLLVLVSAIIGFTLWTQSMIERTQTLEQRERDLTEITNDSREDRADLRATADSLTETVESLTSGLRKANRRLTALGEPPVVPENVYIPVPGKTGQQGVEGKRGKPGADGQNGADGRDGAQGPRGEKGEKGEKGDPATCEGEFVCEGELQAALAQFATQEWVASYVLGLTCSVDGPGGQIFTCSLR